MHAHARRDIGDVGGNGSSAPESTVAAAATQRRVADALKSDPVVVEVQWLEKPKVARMFTARRSSMAPHAI